MTTTRDDEMADKDAAAPEILGHGFCRGCRTNVDTVANKKGKPVCALCSCPRVD